MLVKKVFYSELVNTATKIFIVLVFILPLTELFHLLDRAVSGSIPRNALLALMTYGTIASFPMIFTIACFFSIVFTINRYCKDHEFAIWQSSGLSPFYWLKQTIYFIVPMTLICALCSMFITPWASQKKNDYENFFVKQQALSFIAPGVFKENDGQVYYIENFSLTSKFAQKVFIQYPFNNIIYNLSAKEGRVDDDNGLISIILKNGYRYELNNLNENNTVLSFKEFRVSIKNQYKPLAENAFNPPTSSIEQLIREKSDNAKSELSWRISIPIMMFIMAFLCVPISIQTGRVQNNLVFILPPIIYSVYNNCILTLNSYIGRGKLFGGLYFVFLIHIIILSLALFLTYLKSLPKGYFWTKNK
ncbi:MAG TPA: LPS export ABC transporter permease LptF [Burkholderiales bacterium]|mgnify:CR=1 FL=1|nr:LPS export ABC transporter permease LptF [Burkholderiales bacterium]